MTINMRGKKFITYGASATIVMLAPANLFNIHTTILVRNKNTPSFLIILQKGNRFVDFSTYTNMDNAREISKEIQLERTKNPVKFITEFFCQLFIVSHNEYERYRPYDKFVMWFHHSFVIYTSYYHLLTLLLDRL